MGGNGLRRPGGAGGGSGGEASRLQVGLGHSARRPPRRAGGRWPRNLGSGGEAAGSWGGVRAPPEARPSRGRADGRTAPEALSLGAPGIPGTENRCLAFRKGVSSLVLAAFLGPRVDLGQGRVAAAAFILGSPAGAHAHPASRARGWCPSPAGPLPWHRGPRGGRGAVNRGRCLLAPLYGCGWSPGTLGGVTEFVRGFQNKKLKKKKPNSLARVPVFE